MKLKEAISKMPLGLAIAMPFIEKRRVQVSACHRGEGLFNVTIHDLTPSELSILYNLGMAVRKDRTSVFWCSDWLDHPPGSRDPIAHHNEKQMQYDRPKQGPRCGLKP